jgi:hypothetical protein
MSAKPITSIRNGGELWGQEVKMVFPVGEHGVSVVIPLPREVDTKEQAELLAKALWVDAYEGMGDFVSSVEEES